MKIFDKLLSPLVLSVIVFLFFQLQVYNINFNFRDEGFLDYNAIRITEGLVPYKDFFVTTTPGTYYVIALLMKLFGNYLIISKVLYVFVILGILYLVSRIYSFKSYLDYVLPLSFAGIFVGPFFATYNIEGLILVLLSFFLLKKWSVSKSSSSMIFLGITTSLIFLFKQSYGLADFAIIIFSIYFLTGRKELNKKISYYLLGIGIIILPYSGYLALSHSLNQFIYYVFFFSRDVKAHRVPFIVTASLFIPFYLFLLYFLKKFSHKKKILLFLAFVIGFFALYLIISPARVGRLFTVFADPLVYYYLALLMVPLTAIYLYWSKKTNQAKDIVLASFFSFGMFFASASSGRDYTTVLITSGFFVPLCLLLINNSKMITSKKSFSVLFVLIFLFPLLMMSVNILIDANKYDSYIANAKNAAGIKIIRSEAKELNAVTQYVKSVVKKNGTIVCFPYCPLMFALTERDSASYFSFFYPETFLYSDGQRFIGDIIKNKVKIIILQRKGNIEPEANFEDKRLDYVKRYFLLHYQLVGQTENFDFFTK